MAELKVVNMPTPPDGGKWKLIKRHREVHNYATSKKTPYWVVRLEVNDISVEATVEYRDSYGYRRGDVQDPVEVVKMVPVIARGLVSEAYQKIEKKKIQDFLDTAEEFDIL